MYSCYLLTETTRGLLYETFPFLYTKPIAHHITEVFGEEATLPSPSECVVYGYIDNQDGLEALFVTVGGKRLRPDGNYYHITWSLNPTKYKPVDSNEVIRSSTTYMPCFPIILNTTPSLQE